jgi:hypothetical protein
MQLGLGAMLVIMVEDELWQIYGEIDDEDWEQLLESMDEYYHPE